MACKRVLSPIGALDNSQSQTDIPKLPLCQHGNVSEECLNCLVEEHTATCPICKDTDLRESQLSHNVVVKFTTGEEPVPKAMTKDKYKSTRQMNAGLKNIQEVVATLSQMLANASKQSQEFQKTAMDAKTYMCHNIDSVVAAIEVNMSNMFTEIDDKVKYNFAEYMQAASEKLQEALQLQTKGEQLHMDGNEDQAECWSWRANVNRLAIYCKGLQQNTLNIDCDDAYVSLVPSSNVTTNGQLMYLKPQESRRFDYPLLRPMYAFGSPGTLDGQLLYPRGIASLSSGAIVVANSGSHNIKIFQNDTQEIITVGSLGTNKKQFNLPWEIATSHDDRIFILDYLNVCVKVLDKHGTYLCQFGGELYKEGRLNIPWRMTIDKLRHIIYIIDKKHGVMKFDLFGHYIGLFASPTQIQQPVAIALDAHKGEVYISDNNAGSIFACTLHGDITRVVSRFGGGLGEPESPDCMAVDPHGRLWVCDCVTHQIYIYDVDTGQMIHRIGRRGKQLGQFDKPCGITFTDTGEVLICEYGNSRVQVFGQNDHIAFPGGIKRRYMYHSGKLR